VTEKLEAAERDILKVTEVSKVKIAALEENLIALDQLNNELTSNSVVLEEKLKEMAEKLKDTERRYSLERDQLLEERSVKSLNVATGADKVAVLEKITNKLQEKVNALTLSKAELEEAAKERDSLRYLIELFQANLDKETAAKEELRKEVNNLKSEKLDLSKQLKFLEQTHTVETKALKKELEGFMAERSNSTFALKDLEDLREVNADLKSKVKHLEQTNAYINMRLKHLSKKDTSGETPEKQLNSYIEVRQRMLDAVEKQVRDVQEKAHMSRLHISEFTKKPSTSPNVDEAKYYAATVGGYHKLTKAEGSNGAAKYGM
jgi:chromosome segregation ATPase